MEIHVEEFLYDIKHGGCRYTFILNVTQGHRYGCRLLQLDYAMKIHVEKFLRYQDIMHYVFCQ